MQGLDRYAYVNNNPLRYGDSTGHFADVLLDAAFLIFDVQQITSEGWTPINTAAFVADIACALIPGATGGGTGLRLAAAGGEVVLQAAERLPVAVKIAQGVGKLIQFADGNDNTSPTSKGSYNSGNFRQKLQTLTGANSSDLVGKEAHHVLPQQFERYFKKLGIDINDPRWGTWVDANSHRNWSYEYNQKWAQFFKDNSYNPTVTQVEEFAQELAEEYEFETYFTLDAK